MTAATNKDLPLEALCGLAAISVLLWHSILGFFPGWTGRYTDRWPSDMAMNGQIWYGAVNGAAAVTLFFVLSGFVLTRRFLITGDQKIILRGAVKRWPRLAGPVLVSVLISWLLFSFAAYRFSDAGAATGSPWLATFANGFEPPFEPRFWDAVRQGAFMTFFRGDSYYNSSLWTMRYEFVGSFIAFGLALLIGLTPRRAHYVRMWLIGMVFVLCYLASPHYAAFPAGVALAAFLPDRRSALPGPAVSIMFLAAFYLSGFTGAQTGAFVLAARLFGSLPASEVLVHILASVLIIAAIEFAPDSFRRMFSGRFAHLLGALSFPLYLIHVLVLCSLGSAMLIWAETWPGTFYASAIAVAATVVGSVLAAIPLMLFNERWVGAVNSALIWVLTPRFAGGAIAPAASAKQRARATSPSDEDPQ